MTSPHEHPWLASRPAFVLGAGAPLHVQIERWLTELIASGELRAGDRLPHESALAGQLGVSRMTLRQALGTLEAAGTVIRRAGRSGGTYICEPRIDFDLTGLAGFTEQMRRNSVRAGARIVSASVVAADRSVAQALGVRLGDRVSEVVRVRTASRLPIALERSYFPDELVPGLLDQRLTGSLFELLGRRYGLVPHVAREVLEPVVARDEEAQLLDVAKGAPLMLIRRTTSTAAGVPVEYARDLFRPDRTTISIVSGVAVATDG